MNNRETATQILIQTFNVPAETARQMVLEGSFRKKGYQTFFFQPTTGLIFDMRTRKTYDDWDRLIDLTIEVS